MSLLSRSAFIFDRVEGFLQVEKTEYRGVAFAKKLSADSKEKKIASPQEMPLRYADCVRCGHWD